MTKLDIRSLSHGQIVHAVLAGSLTIDEAHREIERREQARHAAALSRIGAAFLAASARRGEDK